jgi:hypothetical protein
VLSLARHVQSRGGNLDFSIHDEQRACLSSLAKTTGKPFSANYKFDRGSSACRAMKNALTHLVQWSRFSMCRRIRDEGQTISASPCAVL